MRMDAIRRFSHSSYRCPQMEATILVTEFSAAASIARGKNNRTSETIKLADQTTTSAGRGVCEAFCFWSASNLCAKTRLVFNTASLGHAVRGWNPSHARNN